MPSLSYIFVMIQRQQITELCVKHEMQISNKKKQITKCQDKFPILSNCLSHVKEAHHSAANSNIQRTHTHNTNEKNSSHLLTTS